MNEQNLTDKLEQSNVPEHLHGGLIRYFIHYIKPGDFLSAVLCNSLVESFGKADDVSRAHLYDLVDFLYNECPGIAWGSVESVSNWLKRRKTDESQAV